jgi:methionyl-tRNA synthetase
MEKRLITSALPYVNNIPHLGNLIQVLSADVFARFCRLYGYETLYVCGTDEYGTATETRALQEGVTPQELCDRYNKIHNEIYQWFNISFDHFGRTSTPQQTRIVQGIFKAVEKNGYITEKKIDQLYCEKCDRFLADRYVQGGCPHCGFGDARGDQCEECGKLLEPTELMDPRCGVCGTPPVVRATSHLYLDLPKALPLLEKWMAKASVEGYWANNAVQMTKSWIRDGLKERCITRDLKWGIPVPRPGFENKVFYVWFDAPIGYVSITSCLTNDWEKWWKNPKEVKLFQFIGKDNIPFHTVIFPSSQLCTGENWTMLHHMSSSEYLNFDGGKFSKSRGRGIFGNDCQDTGIPADVWRFYIYYNRPEKSDYNFTWEDFQEKYNSELIGNLGNLVNRTLTFLHRFYDGKVPEGTPYPVFVKEVQDRVKTITEKLDRAELRDAFKEIFALSSLGNKAFQDGEPWKTRNDQPEKAASLLRGLVCLVRDLAVLCYPYIPATAVKIGTFFGMTEADLKWDLPGSFIPPSVIREPVILFQKLEKETVDQLRVRFAGTQEERKLADAAGKAAAVPAAVTEPTGPLAEVELKAARIVSVEKHPEAEKLYIIKLDAGEPDNRTIVSGLVGHYTAEELANRMIVLVANLKPAKLRGIMSQGMLLAAEDADHKLEVLDPGPVAPGSLVIPAGGDAAGGKKQISIDRFFANPLSVKAHRVSFGEIPLTVEGRELKTARIAEGKVG